jgi:hypothetical protein
MRGGVCTAGIDADGRWVRPVRPAREQIWRASTASDYCLLPIDFFHDGKSHLVNLGVTRVYLMEHAPDPPHIEDWIIDTQRKPELLRKLPAAEQQEFLERHREQGISQLVPEQRVSLCLFRPKQFSFLFRAGPTGDNASVRASFVAGGEEIRDISCTDLRMRALGRSLLQGKPVETEVRLNEEDFQHRGKRATYLAVGLSRRYQGKHWPLVVGVHSIPELEVEIDYARL